MSELVRYGGWSPARGALMFGLSGPAAITILAGGLPSLLAVSVRNWAALLGTIPAWVLLSVLVVVPVRGRPAARWLLDWAMAKVGAMRGWSRFQSKVAAGTVSDTAEADLPGVLSGIRTHDGPPYGPLLMRPVLIADNIARTWAAVARIEHPGIGVAAASKRAGQARAFSELLEGIAGSELVSVTAVTVRSVPDDGTEREAWERANRSPSAPAMATAVNRELAAVLTTACVRTEAFVTVVVSEHRIARHAKDAGGGIEGRARVIHSVMADVEARLLGGIGCTSVSWLDSPALAEAIRTGFAPGDRGALRSAAMDGHGEDGLPMAAAGPMHAEPPEARFYAHDAWRSASFGLVLPDKGAVMGALAPIVAPGVPGERRCMSVFYEALPRHRADKKIGKDAMKKELANELRERGGFRTRASDRRDRRQVAERDENFAEGFALVRCTAVASVTVPRQWSISQYSRDLSSAITRSGFRPFPLDLAEDSGFVAACIPLGVGLPRQRGE